MKQQGKKGNMSLSSTAFREIKDSGEVNWFTNGTNHGAHSLTAHWPLIYHTENANAVKRGGYFKSESTDFQLGPMKARKDNPAATRTSLTGCCTWPGCGAHSKRRQTMIWCPRPKNRGMVNLAVRTPGRIFRGRPITFYFQFVHFLDLQ